MFATVAGMTIEVREDKRKINRQELRKRLRKDRGQHQFLRVLRGF